MYHELHSSCLDNFLSLISNLLIFCTRPPNTNYCAYPVVVCLLVSLVLPLFFALLPFRFFSMWNFLLSFFFYIHFFNLIAIYTCVLFTEAIINVVLSLCLGSVTESSYVKIDLQCKVESQITCSSLNFVWRERVGNFFLESVKPAVDILFLPIIPSTAPTYHDDGPYWQLRQFHLERVPIFFIFGCQCSCLP